MSGLQIMMLARTALTGCVPPLALTTTHHHHHHCFHWRHCRYKMDKSMFAVAILSGLVCIVEDPTMGIIVGALLGMIVMLLQMRTAHATLRLYSGPLCRLNYLFEGVDTARTTTACKKKYSVSGGRGRASGGQPVRPCRLLWRHPTTPAAASPSLLLLRHRRCC